MKNNYTSEVDSHPSMSEPSKDNILSQLNPVQTLHLGRLNSLFIWDIPNKMLYYFLSPLRMLHCLITVFSILVRK
jgi:hypothetical protein